MEFASFDLVASLQALPETDPIEVDGIQFGGHETCEWECSGFASVQVRPCASGSPAHDEVDDLGRC